MWLEDRWVFARRIYGSELIQKIFMFCLNFIYGINKIQGRFFQAIQNTVVRELFDEDPKEFFANINRSTWVHFWDQKTSGYISQNTAYWISRRINIMGPTAAICGRDFELFILEEERFATCPVLVLEKSVSTCQQTLNVQSFDDDAQGNWTRNNRWSQSSASSAQ